MRALRYLDKRPIMTTEEYLREKSKLELNIDVLASSIKQLQYERALIELKIAGKKGGSQ